jgi:hypothetical protein
MAETEWNPDEEIDPVKLQKEHLELGKEMLRRLKAQEEETRVRKEEYREAMAAAPAASAYSYSPPSLEEVSGVLKRAWVELVAIMPDAPAEVTVVAFEMLVRAAAPPPRMM